MKSTHRSKGIMILAGAGSALGGYFAGKTADAKRTTYPSSPFMSYAFLAPILLGSLSWFLLRKKKPTIAKGLLYGGVVGAGIGYYQSSKLYGGSGASYAGTGTGGTGGSPTGSPGTASTGQAKYLGAARRRAKRMGAPIAPAVRRILRSPVGSGLGDMILPNRMKTGSSAFGKDAWSR